MTLRYGPKPKSLGIASTVSAFDEYSMLMGYIGGSKKPKLYYTYELYGIEVMITDQAIATHIADLTAIGKDKGEAEAYLHRILFIALEQQPEYLEVVLKAKFDKGVIEGRRQKVKEFRKVISD